MGLLAPKQNGRILMTMKMIGPLRRSSGQMERRSISLNLTLNPLRLPVIGRPRSHRLWSQAFRRSLSRLRRSQLHLWGPVVWYSKLELMLNGKQELRALPLTAQMTKFHLAPPAQHRHPSLPGPLCLLLIECLQSMSRFSLTNSA